MQFKTSVVAYGMQCGTVFTADLKEDRYMMWKSILLNNNQREE